MLTSTPNVPTMVARSGKAGADNWWSINGGRDERRLENPCGFTLAPIMKLQRTAKARREAARKLVGTGMSELEGSAQAEKVSWVWFSTHETIENEILSVTAVLETVIAVPLYWWIALKVGIVWPLAISVAIAPLVLLRSDASVQRGIRWMQTFATRESPIKFERQKEATTFLCLLPLVCFALIFVAHLTNIIEWNIFVSTLLIFLPSTILMAISTIMIAIYNIAVFDWEVSESDDISATEWIKLFAVIPFVFGFALATLIISIVIRAFFSIAEWRSTIPSLPKNFRRVIFSSSPAHIPELVPGADKAHRKFTIDWFIEDIFDKNKKTIGDFIGKACGIIMIFIMFFPAWLYRFTIKSTSWFWWPLAFLGGDLQRATNPKVFHWQVMGSLWAKASIGVALGTLLAFTAANLYPVLFLENPLLTPIGYLLLVDWSIRPPSQILALLGALLSVWVVLRINDASGEYRIALDQSNVDLLRTAERNFGRTEFLARVRLLVFIAFWLVVGVHALLYFNSQRCWFTLSPELRHWAVAVYGGRLPRPCQCMVWPIFGLGPLERLNAN